MTGKLLPHEMEMLLRRNVLGRIGCTDGDRIYVVPVNYILEDETILCNSQPGMKIHLMRENPKVCFEVDEMKSFTQWQSIIVHGRYEEITGRKEKHDAALTFITHMMRQEVAKIAPATRPMVVPVHPRSFKARTIFYRIVIAEMTGRFEDSERNGHVYDPGV
jgi:uncharacterized protein